MHVEEISNVSWSIEKNMKFAGIFLFLQKKKSQTAFILKDIGIWNL